MKYKKKPIIIEAIQWDGREENMKEVLEFTKNKARKVTTVDQSEAWLMIDTLEGEMKIDPKDFIIKGIEGEFYPCKPSIFEKTYDKVGVTPNAKSN